MNPFRWTEVVKNWISQTTQALQTRAVLLLVLICVPGCFSPPRRASELSPSPPTAQTPSVVPGPVAEGGLPNDWWKQSGELLPRVALTKGRRVVVTEFDVEFVDLQFQLPTPRQLMFKPLPISLNPVHLATGVIGLGRRSSWMTEEEQQALAAELYDAFGQDLRRRGLELVSQDVLHASAAYTEFRKKSVVRSSPLMLLNPVGSDTGIAKHTRTLSAPGLCVLRGNSYARAAAETRILRETGADVAVAVRLRVGTFREQPALEQRSVVRLTTCEGSTTLRARHSLVSDVGVINTARFRPIVGRIEPVEAAMFSSELTAMLPRFVAVALSEPKS